MAGIGRDVWKQAAAGVTGGIVGAAFVLAGAPWLLAAAAAAAGYFGARLMLQGDSSGIQVDLSSVLSPEEFVQAVEERVESLRKLEPQIPDPGMQGKVKRIRGVAQEILEDLKRHPEDVPHARRFFNYYFDTTLKILEKYIEFANFRGRSDAMERSMQRVENLLDLVEKAFLKELAHLTENDVIDLEAEIDVFRKTARIEGIGEDFHEE